MWNVCACTYISHICNVCYIYIICMCVSVVYWLCHSILLLVAFVTQLHYFFIVRTSFFITFFNLSLCLPEMNQPFTFSVSILTAFLTFSIRFLYKFLFSCLFLKYFYMVFSLWHALICYFIFEMG